MTNGNQVSTPEARPPSAIPDPRPSAPVMASVKTPVPAKTPVKAAASKTPARPVVPVTAGVVLGVTDGTMMLACEMAR